ncbi:hypothetical protein L1887_46801 [Cichorium endivia]|nr:hypothetical protein L1887_46801 [Cichorium endivia]
MLRTLRSVVADVGPMRAGDRGPEHPLLRTPRCYWSRDRKGRDSGPGVMRDDAMAHEAYLISSVDGRRRGVIARADRTDERTPRRLGR